jgi:hypothetical protein
MPRTPTRSLRVPDAVWEAAKAKASADGRTMTDVIVGFLRLYGKRPGSK